MKSLESNVTQNDVDIDNEEIKNLKDKVNGMYLNQQGIMVQAERRKLKLNNDLENKSKPKSNFMTMSVLEEYNLQDMNDTENQPFVSDETFIGPLEDRTYTDKRYIFCFILMTGLFLAGNIYVIMQGSLRRLEYGQDFRSEICGTGLLKDKKYQYFLEPSVNTDIYMCVKECPTQTGPQICLYDRNQTVIPSFCYTQLSTKPYQNYCMNDEPQNSQKVRKWIITNHSLFFRLISDIYKTWHLIIISIFIGIIVMIIVNILLQNDNLIKVIIWITTWSTFLTINLFAILCYTQYQLRVKFICINHVDIRNCGDFYTYLFYYAMYGFIIFSIIYILFMMFQYNSINLSIELLKTTIRTGKVIKELTILPYILIVIAILIILLVLFTIFSAASIGTIIEIDQMVGIDGHKIRKIKFNTYYTYIFITVVSFAVVLIQFLNRINDMIISYSLTLWYFTKQKESLRLPIRRVITIPLQYHFGTIFKLTLMEFWFQYLRILFDKIINYLKSKPQHYRSVRYISNSLRCFLYWYMNSLRYISKDLLAQVALWSDDYKQASKKQFFLQYRNRQITRDVEFITFLVIFQLKLFCSIFGCLFYFGLVELFFQNQLSSYMMGVIVTLTFNFYIIGIVINQHQIVSKTIILSYYIDNEMFIGDQRFVEQFIQEFMKIFSNVSDQAKQIVVDTFKPEIKGGTTTVNPMDEERQALKFKKLVENSNVNYEVRNNDDGGGSNSTQLNPSALLQNVNKYGKPISNKKVKSNKVGFDDNPIFSKQKVRNDLDDYDPFGDDFNQNLQSNIQNPNTRSTNQLQNINQQKQNTNNSTVIDRNW